MEPQKPGNKSLSSFTNRSFHLSRPPGFRMVFDAAERKETSIPLEKDNGSQSKKQSYPGELSKNCRGTLFGVKDRGERDR